MIKKKPIKYNFCRVLGKDKIDEIYDFTKRIYVKDISKLKPGGVFITKPSPNFKDPYDN